MEPVLNIYYLTFDPLLCLNVCMDTKTLQIDRESQLRRETDVDDECGGKLLIKNAYTDVTGSPYGYIYKTPEDWCELQDKILRILTYKYYESDYSLTSPNDGKSMKEIDYNDTKYRHEREMEVCNLQEYADMSLPTIEVQVAHEFLPIQINPQHIIIQEDRFWVKTWKLLKNILTFRSCRRE